MSRSACSSGGVDSSAIAAIMKPTSRSGQNLRRRLPEAEFSEPPTPATSPGHRHRHHEIVVGMDDFFNALPPDLARGRTHRLALQRLPLLRQQTGPRAGHRSAYRRVQRRNVRRLRALPFLFHEPALAPPLPLSARPAAVRNSQPGGHNIAAQCHRAPQTSAHLRGPWGASGIALPGQLLLGLFRAQQRQLFRAPPGLHPMPTSGGIGIPWTAFPRSRACCIPTRKPTWWNCS